MSWYTEFKKIKYTQYYECGLFKRLQKEHKYKIKKCFSTLLKQGIISVSRR